MITSEDLKTAVRSGLISEAQATGLTALADQRMQEAAGLAPSEEPFQLFRGFNEIFIVIGLSILFAGWTGVLAAILTAEGLPGTLSSLAGVALTLAGLYGVQRYFTLTRRMVAPSIALAVMFGLSFLTLGGILGEALDLPFGLLKPLTFATAAVGMMVHYRIFRVPFDALLIGGAVFTTVWTWLAHRNMVPDDAFALLHFSSSGLPALLSMGFGLGCFALAMRFDLSDPRRISTRAATGFWLHVLAAPAIINPLALRLLSYDHSLPLLAILCLLALVALVIDRRSFLVSGAAYAVGIVFALFDSPMLVILGLGLGLVFLGAQWDRLRGALLRALPEFPGKTRLPPYGQRI
ncbi:hypothetical protein ACFOHK_10900 [Falsigemmobacter intermedius]|uniref:DUF2157 domain-containing protein n=1 Tax=Falsigemmobacter intermedius TaxID=1553448 RepID=A0A444MG52_9RHOB|nr:hypothetical protein [Falsigemmobacter intermedius]RWY44653.1 hypothetical protein EP867_01555 [Falsigemmobacter intermedius]